MILRFISLSFFFLFVTSNSFAQRNFGVEIIGGTYKTYDQGLPSVSEGFTVISQKPMWTNSVGQGFLLYINKKHLLKLQLKSHRNGFVADLEQHIGDCWGCPEEIWNDVENEYRYLQINPSYTYISFINKFFFPFEIGVNYNRVQRQDIFIGIKRNNFDLSLGLGVGYLLSDKVSISILGRHNRYLNDYQHELTFEGSYKPIQVGVELGIQYSFKKRNTDDIEVDLSINN